MAYYYLPTAYECNYNQNLVDTITTGPATECLTEASAIEKNKAITIIGQNNSQLNIIRIKTVKNNFLEAMYLLKKAEMASRYGQVTEILLIHATSAANVGSIVKDNFNWRRVKRGKFGVGTSFSGDAKYANRYCNPKIGDDRAFIITKVLVSRCSKGYMNQSLPPSAFDTTIGNGKKVYVKYCDNEMLPQFIVYYRNYDSQCKIAPQLLSSQLTLSNHKGRLREESYYNDDDTSYSTRSQTLHEIAYLERALAEFGKPKVSSGNPHYHASTAVADLKPNYPQNQTLKTYNTSEPYSGLSYSQTSNSYTRSQTPNSYTRSQTANSYTQSQTLRSYTQSQTPNSYTQSQTANSYAQSQTLRSYTQSQTPSSYTQSQTLRSYTQSQTPNSYTQSQTANSYAQSQTLRSYTQSQTPNSYTRSQTPYYDPDVPVYGRSQLKNTSSESTCTIL